MDEQGTVRNTVIGDEVAGVVVQAQTISNLSVWTSPPTPPGPDPAAADDWLRRADGAGVWRHVGGGRECRAGRDAVAAVLAVLAERRDVLEAELAADPWADPGLPSRFLEQIELLLGEPDRSPGFDLYPAEAALLVLLPFLHRVHYLERAALLAGIRPWSLRPEEAAGPDRRAYEVFVDQDETLVQRALRSPEGEAQAQAGWWLFHRWLVQQREFADPRSVAGLLEGLGAGAAASLGEVLAPRRITALLQGLRRGPDVCHPEFLGQLAAEERVRTADGPQLIREQRLMLLGALGHAMTPGMTAMPGIVAEHLAIPHPVNLVELHRTLREAAWGGSPELPVLRAECRHEAVVEGLREYVGRVDEVLDAVRRTARDRITDPLPVLPVRLSADAVTAADGAFDGYARFRSDGRRFRDLAMGIELYKDRDLAVRELYQNALDACRYRRARSEYLDRTHPPAGRHQSGYEGRISFVQGVDADGVGYLECTDNGVGMGEAELRGVFAQAGARFAEQLEFKLERAAWEALDPPVTLYPNSRFGIGVLSYFMLADEVSVTTCRMAPDGSFGPVYEVSICGPGHLFRIVKTALRGREAGTTIRLRLRPGLLPEGWSSVGVLERLLGIAEFETTAEDGGEGTVWPAGRFKPRADYDPREFGLSASGTVREWVGAPAGAHVLWCERGGALLVDGLVVDPVESAGVLAGRGLVGAVINLTGPWSPARLSVDRRNVIDDVEPVVRGLLEGAAHVLAGGEPEFSDYAWLCRVATASAPLADIVTTALAASGRRFLVGGAALGGGDVGFFPADVFILRSGRRMGDLDTSEVEWLDTVPDHILLWRVLAQRPQATMSTLVECCPEVGEVQGLRSALPSDQVLVRNSKVHLDLNDIARIARGFRADPRDVARQADALGFPGLSPANWTRDARLTTVDSRVFDAISGGIRPDCGPVTTAALMVAVRECRKGPAEAAAHLRGFGCEVPQDVVEMCETAEHEPLIRLDPKRHGGACFMPGSEVPAGHLAKASLDSGLAVSEVCLRLAAHGLRPDAAGLPEHPGEELVALLSVGGNGKPSWLERSRAATPGHVLAVAQRSQERPGEVIDRLEALGFGGPRVMAPHVAQADVDVLSDRVNTGFLDPEEPLSYVQVFDGFWESPERMRHRIARLRAYGFRVPLEVPKRPTDLDRDVLHGGIFPWHVLDVGATVPLAHVVAVAYELQVTPAVLARRLQVYRLQVSHASLPEGLSEREAWKLIGMSRKAEGDVPTSRDFSLQVLCEAAEERGKTLHEIVELLRQLGLDVPDPAQTIRAALARVPRA